MTHYTCMVIGPDPEGQLAPFDEDIQVEPYEGSREPLADAVRKAREWAVDPRNTRQPAIDINDDQAVLGWYHEGETFKVDGDEFVLFSTYNPKSKWDWYRLGGRWEGFFTLKDGSTADQAHKGDIDFDAMTAENEGFLTFAMLADGAWMEPGRMGWFAMTDATDESRESYDEKARQIIAGLPDDTLLSVFDLHI